MSATNRGSVRKPRKTKECAVCGCEFAPRPYAFDVAKYCSRKCEYVGKVKFKERQLEVVAEYLNGKGAKRISKMLSIPIGPVISLLKLAGVYDPNRALGRAGVPYNKGCRSYNADTLIMDYYKKELRAMRRFDDEFHWGNHKAVAVWFVTKAWMAKSEDERRYILRKRYNEIKGDPDRWREFILRKRSMHSRWRSKGANRFRKNLSTRLYMELLQNGRKKVDSITKYLGCSIAHLRTHLQSQFVGRMSWSNYGRCWHVDHIIPCAEFDHSDESQVKQCWNWLNLRPMWARQNQQKGAHITEPQQHLVLTV